MSIVYIILSKIPIMDEIEFVDIVKLFNSSVWDVAYLSEEGFNRAGHSPIKTKMHFTGYDITNHLHNNTYNGIVLAKYSEESNDYSIYEDSLNILSKNFSADTFIQTYLNFKEASLLSGFGYRAKNSLVYNRKFGFQCKLCAYMFAPSIINYEKLKPTNKELLDLCDGCTDCIKNCPVGAIHEDWIDARKCDSFIGVGNHPTIPSIKWFWYEKMQPPIPREEVESWDEWSKTPKFEWGQGIDGYYENDNGVLKKDGVVVSLPHCRECQKQPRCSKAPLFNDVK